MLIAFAISEEDTRLRIHGRIDLGKKPAHGELQSKLQLVAEIALDRIDWGHKGKELRRVFDHIVSLKCGILDRVAIKPLENLGLANCLARRQFVGIRIQHVRFNAHLDLLACEAYTGKSNCECPYPSERFTLRAASKAILELSLDLPSPYA